MAETNRRKENIRRAAIWASLGFSQEEISHRLGIQQSGVSKMLKEARKARLLSDPAPIYHGPKKEVDDEESLLGLGDLKRLLKDLACLERESNADIWPTDELPTIEPFYSGPDKNKLPEWSEGLMNWASHACGAIQKLILSSCRSGQPNLIGVASGRHLLAVAEQIRLLKRETPTSPIDFTPLMGMRNVMVREALDIFSNPYEKSSNDLSLKYHEIFNAGNDSSPVLDKYLPGCDFIPFEEEGRRSVEGNDQSFTFELKDSQGNILKQQNRQRTELYKSVISQENDYLATIKRHFFSAFQSYRAAFNEPRALNPNQKPTASYGTVFHLDGIIAAVGDSKATSIFKDMPQSRYGGIPNDWFNTNIVGDIASVLLRRQDLKKSTLIDEQFSRIMNRWMGADEMHIRRCADKSRELRTLGVIVMGVGSSRAEVILEVLRRGLCNHLFIDFNLLVSLVRLIKKIIAEVTSR